MLKAASNKSTIYEIDLIRFLDDLQHVEWVVNNLFRVALAKSSKKSKWLPKELAGLIASFYPQNWKWLQQNFTNKVNFPLLNDPSLVRIVGRSGRCIADHCITMTKRSIKQKYVCFELVLHKISNASNVGFVSYPIEDNYPIFAESANVKGIKHIKKKEIMDGSPKSRWWNSWLGFQPNDYCLGISDAMTSFWTWSSGKQKQEFRISKPTSWGSVVTFCVDLVQENCQIWINEESLGLVFTQSVSSSRYYLKALFFLLRAQYFFCLVSLSCKNVVVNHFLFTGRNSFFLVTDNVCCINFLKEFYHQFCNSGAISACFSMI
ncbi:hypothetical protein RFI_13861 [Reticulomyxa filosa]|uniref:Uncharacterized protein n=1 Tax=Reticulomyxa filosa TaxID=46433 RepID=X6NAJ8_RETFI|nr:hypothetical protein RFI_13861 [Reticulomyxa filosa]|eukprot:ETO23320.1 hypothetical protein RFI_13861 [Reticulomyxa filosa]